MRRADIPEVSVANIFVNGVAGFLFLALALALTFRPGPAHADPNTVFLEPSAVEVAPGGAVTVALVADPPAQTLAIWGIDVEFDPDVVSTTSRGCDSLDPLPDSQTVTACEVVDGNEDGRDDTVKVLGAMIFNDTGLGLSDPAVLAEITFNVVGEPGLCTDLRLRVQFHDDSDGKETDPLLSDGLICVEQDAPPGGTAVPHTPDARTSEPIPPGGGGLTPPPLDTGVAAGGGGTPATGSGSPANGGGTSTSGAGPDAGGSQNASPSDSASQTPAPGESGEEGGGGGVLIWALVILAVMIAAGGVAWAVVRRRGAGSGPEGGPSAG
jgi:hypothetical protein